MAKAKIYKDSNGKKLYPVCGFQKNQHKFDYWYTKAMNKWYENPDDDDAWEDRERKERWMECATCFVFDGLIYAPWELYNEMKEAIVCYDLCH